MIRFHLLDTVPNPCMAASNDKEQYYPFAFSARAYVQCNGDLLYVQPCAEGLYWNQEAKICDREEASLTPSAENQPKSFEVNYGSNRGQHQQQLNGARASTNFVDQNVDKQQGYRYRNYNPHNMAKGER